MKKIFSLLLLLLSLTAIAQNNPTKLAGLILTNNPLSGSANRAIVQDSATGLFGYVSKSEFVDIVEANNFASFPVTGLPVHIYIDKSTNNIYRWDGTKYVLLNQIPVEEYTDLISFPVTGAEGIIYIAQDTSLTYVWNGTTYVLTSPPVTGITGFGNTNRVAYFTSSNSIGSSILFNNPGGYISINNSTPLAGNTLFSIRRSSGQSQMDFVLGNPTTSQPSYITADNVDGFGLWSYGDILFRTGSGLGTEVARLNATNFSANGFTTNDGLMRLESDRFIITRGIGQVIDIINQIGDPIRISLGDENAIDNGTHLLIDDQTRFISGKGFIRFENGIDDGNADYTKTETGSHHFKFRGVSGADGDGFGLAELNVSAEIEAFSIRTGASSGTIINHSPNYIELKNTLNSVDPDVTLSVGISQEEAYLQSINIRPTLKSYVSAGTAYLSIGAKSIDISTAIGGDPATGNITIDNVKIVTNKLTSKTTTEILALTPTTSEMYYNTTLNTIVFYNGTSWQKVTTTNM